MTTIARLKVYREHECDRVHRSFLSFARCAMSWAHPVTQGEPGETPYALITRCQPRTLYVPPRVSLWTTQQMAELQSTALCGGGCKYATQGRFHEVIRLEMRP